MKSSAPPRRAASRILSSSCASAGLPSPMFSLICVYVKYVASVGAWTHGEGKVCVVLEEDGHGSAEVGQSESLDVAVVDKDGALCRIVDAGDEFQDCTLSRSIPPYNHL
jgi:hypothetical protein